MVDPTNGGHLHAPSLNQAVTAAVLRAGELANRTGDAPGAFSINLSSERVRRRDRADGGAAHRPVARRAARLPVRAGPARPRRRRSSSTQLVFAFRRAFPLTADRLSTDRRPAAARDRGVEARNVIDGLALVKRAGPAGQLPLRQPRPAEPADLDPERADRGGEDRRATWCGIFDALADLVLAEGVHQAAQSNPERAGAHIDVQGDFTAPPDPTVTQHADHAASRLTSGSAVELDAGRDRAGRIDPAGEGPAGGGRAGSPPRCRDLGDIACTVTWTVAGGPEQSPCS